MTIPFPLLVLYNHTVPDLMYMELVDFLHHHHRSIIVITELKTGYHQLMHRLSHDAGA